MKSEQPQVQDPGFGQSFKGRYRRLVNKDGSFNVERHGAGVSLADAYVYLLGLGWTKFLLLVLLTFTIINSVFAGVYMAIGIEHLAGTSPGNWWQNFSQAFFFSVQTFTTVGYGAMSPSSPLAGFIASFEALGGLMGFAVASGLLYGRFSRPNARVLFSKNMVIAPYRDINALMFRVINQRSNVLLEMEARVTLVLTDTSKSERQRRYYRLKLELSTIHFFPMAWTIVHPIDEDSPLYGMNARELEQQEAELLILLRGFDDKFSQVVFVRRSYTWEEAVIGARFVPNFTREEDGTVTVDVNGVHDWDQAELN